MRSRKPYTLEEVVRMLPYIRSFCRSLKERSQEAISLLINGLKMNPEEVAGFKELNHRRRLELKEEIERMRMCSCSDSCGFIDMPMLHPHRGILVAACIGDDTESEEDLKVHLPGEGFEHRRSLWKL